jgi:hypothetical protein
MMTVTGTRDKGDGVGKTSSNEVRTQPPSCVLEASIRAKQMFFHQNDIKNPLRHIQKGGAHKCSFHDTTELRNEGKCNHRTRLDRAGVTWKRGRRLTRASATFIAIEGEATKCPTYPQ